MTLMTFQPAPRKSPSSSWMIFPLPRTGPSSRWRLQFTTQMMLSRFSRAASVMAPSDSGSSDSPSPRNAQTFGSSFQLHEAARLQVAVEPRLIQRQDRAKAHRDGRELPEIRHQIRMRIRRQPVWLRRLVAGCGRDAPVARAGRRGVALTSCDGGVAATRPRRVPAGNSASAARPAGLRETPAHTCPARRGPENKRRRRGNCPCDRERNG